MSHMPECRHKTAECNCEALELRSDLEHERKTNSTLLAERDDLIEAVRASEIATSIARSERDRSLQELEACGKRLRQFDDCIPTAAANTTLRIEREHHESRIAAAVAAERERVLADLESMMRNGEVKALMDKAAAAAVADEREACAKLVEPFDKAAATAIRARGGKS